MIVPYESIVPGALIESIFLCFRSRTDKFLPMLNYVFIKCGEMFIYVQIFNIVIAIKQVYSTHIREHT